MDEEQYKALLGYIVNNDYPSGYSKGQKFVLRRSSKNYVVEGSQLLYVDRRKDGSTINRLVLRGTAEVDRVYTECHLSNGGHRGRDTTIGKVKERYYWPSYYKDIEHRVSMLCMV